MCIFFAIDITNLKLASTISFFAILVSLSPFWIFRTNFLNSYNFNLPRFIIYSQIKEGNIKLVFFAGFLMAMHFIFWFGALKLTSIASTTILGIVAPAFTLIFERFYYKRELSWATIFALFIIFIGCLVVQINDIENVGGAALGNIMAIVSAIFLGGLFLLGSIIRKTTPVISYTRMLFSVSAVVLLIVSFVLHSPLLGYSNIDYFWLLMLGLVPTLIGHTAFSYSVKFISPSVIAAIPLGEPIIASGLAWLLFSEKVSFNVAVGGIFIGIGLILLIKNNTEK